MSEFIITLIVNSLFIIGIHQSTKQGMILNFVTKNKLPYWLKKPLYACPTCMASIHSYVYLVFYSLTVDQLKFIPVYILALAGLNTLFNSIVIYIEIED